jgi:hypothetical protein
MPILYLRARKGAHALPAATKVLGPDNNTIITYDTVNEDNRVGQYDLHQIIGYTGQTIGVGRKLSGDRKGWPAANDAVNAHGLRDPLDVNATMQSSVDTGSQLKPKFPYDAYPYLRNASLSTPQETDSAFTQLSNDRNDVPHQKDAFILISAGSDRIYGTKDDITNFLSVK